jgi:hypothetical protein
LRSLQVYLYEIVRAGTELQILVCFPSFAACRVPCGILPSVAVQVDRTLRDTYKKCIVPLVSMKYPLRVVVSSTLDGLVYRLETASIVVEGKDTMVSRLEMYPEEAEREFLLHGY